MKRRNNENGKFYCISNPTEVNLHTGNFCVAYKYVSNYDKDFLFDWVNPVNNKHIYKSISKEYVLSHCKPCPKWMYDELESKYKLKGMFYLIAFKDIYNY